MARYAAVGIFGIFVLGLLAIASSASAAKFDTVAKDRADKMGCLSCHEGIEQFADGPMMETIIDMGTALRMAAS